MARQSRFHRPCWWKIRPPNDVASYRQSHVVTISCFAHLVFGCTDLGLGFAGRAAAARANRLQTSLNLALGSALASIGLTIPAVAIVSIATGWSPTLGLDNKSSVLLLSLFVATLSLGTGRNTVLQGVTHLVIFAAYLFTTIVP